MILEEIATLFEELEKKQTHREISRHFGRERKFVMNVKNGCNFVLDAKFVAGLKEYGYELNLRKIGDGKQ